jgi:hypothetical protein
MNTFSERDFAGEFDDVDTVADQVAAMLEDFRREQSDWLADHSPLRRLSMCAMSERSWSRRGVMVDEQ